MQRHLGMKIDPAAAMCEECHAHLDGYGWHRTTCMRTGRVQVRHIPLLHVWQRLLREAGVPIAKQNFECLLRTTHIRRGPNDLRRMDLISAGIDGIPYCAWKGAGDEAIPPLKRLYGFNVGCP